MKKKAVVKALALLLTSVMLLESPIQSLAAESVDVTGGQQESDFLIDSEAGQEEEAGTQDEENASYENDENPDGNKDSDEENGSDDSDEDSTGENGQESGTGTDENTGDADTADSDVITGTDGESVSGIQNDGINNEANTLPITQTVNSAANLLTEDADSEVLEFTLTGTQFGTEPNQVEEIGEKYTEFVNAVKNSWETSEGSETPTTTIDVDPGLQLNSVGLPKLLSKIVEDAYGTSSEYTMLLPQVQYTADEYGYITGLTFSYIEENGKMNLSGAEWTDSGIEISFTSIVSADKYELLRTAVDTEEKTLIEFTPDASFKYADEDAVKAPHNYRYLLRAYDADGNMCTYSEIIDCPYTLAVPENFRADMPDFSGLELNWDAVKDATSYTLSRKVSGASDESYSILQKSADCSFKDVTGEAGETYTYQLTAECENSAQSYTWTSGPVTVDAQIKKAVDIGNVTVTASSDACDRLKLNWNAASNASGYLVYRVENGEYKQIADVNACSYQLTGLNVETVYRYAVCPYRTENGEKIYGKISDTVSGRTKMMATSMTAAAQAYNQILLKWVKAPQCGGYEIYRKAENGTEQLLTKISSADTLSYTDNSIICGTLYTYRIRPIRVVGSETLYGDFSGAVSARTSLQASAIQQVTSVDYQTLNITWSQVAGATGYEIYVSGKADGQFTKVADTSSVSYRHTGLTLGSTYYYKIRAYRTENGKKVYASDSNMKSCTVNLGTVTGVRAAATRYNTIQVTWSKMAQATNYEIYYSTSPDSGYKFLKRVGKNTTKYNFTKALCGTTYYFQIRPYQKVKKVINYGSFSAAVSARTTIGTPSPYVSKTTYNSIMLKWKKVSGAKLYRIYYSTSADGTWRELMTTKKTSLTLKNLMTGTTYNYKVTAIRDNFESPLSSSTSGRPVLGTLSKLKASGASSTQIKVSWGRVTGAEKYVILRSTSQNGTYAQVGTATKTSYTDSGLASGTTYYYKVYALRGSYQTNAAGPASGRTKDPGSVSTKEESKKVYKGVDVSSYQGTIDWDAVKGDGIDFAMIRITKGQSAGEVNLDSKFERNYKYARAAGLDVGVYRYSYATTRTLARKEAKAVIEALDGRRLDYPIVMDFEDSSILQKTSGNQYRAEIILAFKEEVEKAGYKFAVYANKNWLDNYIDMSMLKDTDIWIARWRSLSSGHGYTGPGNVAMWQYSSTGSVDGISGNVDLNVCYKKY